MTLIMAAAAIYGVLQMALLASPVRSLRISTVLVTLAVGMYGSGVVATLIEYVYARAAVSHPGQSLSEAMGSGAYTLVPVIEELAQIAPLLLAGWNLKIRSQMGMADFVVLGAAAGAGLGLFEVLLAHMLDAQEAFPLPGGGGWMLSGGIGGIGSGAPYLPDWATVLSHWLPAQVGSLDMSYTETSLGTNLHLAWGAIDAFGVALLLRTRGWRRLLGLIPITYAMSHHALGNYPGPGGGRVPDDAWQRTLLKHFESLVGWLPLVCLVLAMVLDHAAIRRGKRAMPGILLEAERSGRTGLAALGGFAAWCMPWTPLIALRFARLRRGLLYSAGRVPPERIGELYGAVANIAVRINASDREGAWNSARVRAHLKSAGAHSPWRRRWPLLLVPLVLMLPSLLFLGAGSFTATKGLQKWFTTGKGPGILMWFGVAALVWTLIQLIMLIRAWRAARHQPVAEPLALIRLRLWASTGALATGGLLLFAHYRRDVPLDGRVAEQPVAMLLALLEDLELYAGIALTILALAALIMIFPPGGLAVAGGGIVTGAATVEAVHAAALGTAGVALMVQGGRGGDSDPVSSRDVHDSIRQGEREVDDVQVWKDGSLYFDTKKGNMLKILDRGDGTFDVVIKDPSNPSGKPITRFNTTEKYVEKRIESGEWE